MIKFECPHCGKSFSAKDSAAGRECRCSSCERPIKVPDLRPAPKTAAAPAAPPPRPDSPPTNHHSPGIASLLDIELPAAAGVQLPSRVDKVAAADPSKVAAKCPKCGKVWHKSRELIGKNAFCPNCKSLFVVAIPGHHPPLSDGAVKIHEPETPGVVAVEATPTKRFTKVLMWTGAVAMILALSALGVYAVWSFVATSLAHREMALNEPDDPPAVQAAGGENHPTASGDQQQEEEAMQHGRHSARYGQAVDLTTLGCVFVVIVGALGGFCYFVLKS